MRKIVAALCLMLVIGLLAGCGERTESTRYYYSPSWTRDGKIIFIGATESVRKDILNSQLGSSSTQYVLTIYPTGTGESSSLFDVTDTTPYAMSCSPTTESAYVAYLDDLRSGLYRKIIIRNIAAGQHSGLEKVELVFSPGIKSFDWSNDGTKLVYCTTQEVRAVDIDGTNDTLVTAEANLEFVTWKYGSNIAFVSSQPAGKVLSLIDPNTKARTDVPVAASVDLPQISPADTNIVYGIAGGSFCSVEATAGSPSTIEVKASFTGELPRLSPDASMVTYSKTGEESGIYILYTATGTEETVK
jgi:Tol biopolymer transport system component